MVWIVFPAARQMWIDCPLRHEHGQNLGAVDLITCLSHIQQRFVEIGVDVGCDVEAAAAVVGVVLVGASSCHLVGYPGVQTML